MRIMQVTLPKLNTNNTKLDLTKNPDQLVQQILGLNPTPKAHYGGFKFLLAGQTDHHNVSEKPVLSVRERQLFLDYSLGSVEILEIQPNGKKNNASQILYKWPKIGHFTPFK